MFRPKKWDIKLCYCVAFPRHAIARPKPHQCRQHFKFNLLEELLPLFHPFWLALDSSIHFTTGGWKSTASASTFAFNTFQLSNTKLIVNFAHFQSLRHPRHGAALPYPQNRLPFPTQRYPVFLPKKNVGNRRMERSIAFPGAPFNSLPPPWLDAGMTKAGNGKKKNACCNAPWASTTMNG